MEEMEREVELIDQARHGDPEAFKMLFAPHQSKIFGAVVNIMRNRQDAEDAVQEALLKAYLNLDQFKGDSKFSTWLMRIAINCALFERRKRRYPKHGPTLASSVDPHEFDLIENRGPSPEHIAITSERVQAVRRAIHSLTPSLKEMAILRGIRGESIRDVMSILQINESLAKSRFCRARKNLREVLTGLTP